MTDSKSHISRVEGFADTLARTSHDAGRRFVDGGALDSSAEIGLLSLVRAEAVGKRAESSSVFAESGPTSKVTEDIKRRYGPVGSAVLNLFEYGKKRGAHETESWRTTKQKSLPEGAQEAEKITPAQDQDPELADRNIVVDPEHQRLDRNDPRDSAYVPLVDRFDEEYGIRLYAGGETSLRPGDRVCSEGMVRAAASMWLSRRRRLRRRTASRRTRSRSHVRRTTGIRALTRAAAWRAVAVTRAIRAAAVKRERMRTTGTTTASMARISARQASRIASAHQRANAAALHRSTTHPIRVALFGNTVHARTMQPGSVDRRAGDDAVRMTRKAGRSSSKKAAQPMTRGAMQVHMSSEGNARAQAPIAAIRPQANTASRASTPMLATLALPAPLAETLQRIINPQIRDGYESLSLADPVDVVVEEALIPRIMQQLKRGPASLGEDDLRCDVNALMPEGYERIERETWESLLQETLLIAIRQIRPFDDEGLRRSDAIYGNAAFLLQLADKSDAASKIFAAWETHFGIHCLAEQLMDPDMAQLRRALETHEDFVRAIKQHLLERASMIFGRAGSSDPRRYSFETRVEWAALRYSAIPDSAHKVKATAAFIVDLAKKNRVAVGRILALVVRHSAMSRSRKQKKNPLVPQWQSNEVREMFKVVMAEAPRIVSDPSLREQLSDWEKKMLNRLIYKANYGDIMTKLSNMGSDRPIEEYIDMIEEADKSGRVMLDIVLDMLKNHEKHKGG